MLGILSFDDGGPAHKRRKAVRACKRCKELKKRCTFTAASRRCHRCHHDNRDCSFEHEPQHAQAGRQRDSLLAEVVATPATLDSHARRATPRRASRLPDGRVPPASAPAAVAMPVPGPSPPEDEPVNAGLDNRSQGALPTVNSIPSSSSSSSSSSPCPSPGAEPLVDPPPVDHTRDGNKEMRYVTMLYLLDSSSSSSKNAAAPTPHHRRLHDPRYASTSKLISGTNPLSALLQRDLKEKIVNNGCSFRTPDPAPDHRAPANAGTNTRGGGRVRVHRRGTGVHHCDWEGYYRGGLGASDARMQYLRALGCFDLPPADRCARLLETYFAHVHPILPVVDRKEFLSRYYGPGEPPPPLVVLHAVFLAASRYAGGEDAGGGGGTTEGRDAAPSVRSHCDRLYAKLRALIETDVCADRVAVVQATLLASLHWEGREGLNSSIDCLGLAVRAGQEMGLHRRTSDATQPGPHRPGGGAPDPRLLRRLWWLTFACDRHTAAQEGTPFLINELDCDVEPLSAADDFPGEDPLTCHVTLLNLALARVIEDVVRSLYALGESARTLFSTRGVLRRQRLSQQLEQLADRITTTLRPDGGPDEEAPQPEPQHAPDIRRLWCAILLTHVDAVRILMHRAFITYAEPAPSGAVGPAAGRCYASRDACRAHALDIVARLTSRASNSHNSHNSLVRLAWPFTVYAVVNCLLVFWYDISSPATSDPAAQAQSRQHYAAVVQLLRAMGDTWWAAAAKHKLAEALAKAADKLRARQAARRGGQGGGEAARRERPVSNGTDGAGDTRRDVSAFAGPADAAATTMTTTTTTTMPGPPYLVQDSTETHGMADAAHPHPPTPHSGSTLAGLGLVDPWSNDVLFSGTTDEDYWASMGLDFDMDVAENLFSIWPTQGGL